MKIAHVTLCKTETSVSTSGFKGGLNELIHMNHLAQFWAHGKCSMLRGTPLSSWENIHKGHMY